MNFSHSEGVSSEQFEMEKRLSLILTASVQLETHKIKSVYPTQIDQKDEATEYECICAPHSQRA